MPLGFAPISGSVGGGGPCDYPSAFDVLNGVIYANGGLIGTLVVAALLPSGRVPLLHSPADVVRRLLIAVGQGAAPPGGPWPVYAGGEPGNPDNCLTVYDTTPRDDGTSTSTGEAYRHYGIQVRLRATDHKTGAAKADAVFQAMTGVLNAVVTVEGHRYVICALANPLVLYLGKDVGRSRRSLFTINCTAALRAVD